LHPRSSLWRWLAYAAAMGGFLWVLAHFYLPGKGYTALVMFGADNGHGSLAELQGIDHYVSEDLLGYDAQYYAQIALRPRLSDPELTRVVDSLPYRARRILLAWTAWLAGGGDPARTLQAFAVQNVVAWLLLAVVLLRWFPPTSWGNFFRWGGVLFGAGMMWSVRGALLDGPSLLLIAVAVALAESGRPWWSAIVLGISGLAKETNLLAGLATGLPRENARRDWPTLAARVALMVLPLALWLGCLWLWLGTLGEPGARNFGLPLAAYVEKWRAVAGKLRADGFGSVERYNVPILIALAAQGLFFLLRPRWREPWWRVGAAYALLMPFLGTAIWEGYPMAAVRVLLPMLLAFNIGVPRGRKWWAVLLLGNQTVLVTPDLFRQIPGRESDPVAGPSALRMAEETGRRVEVAFDGEWYPAERSYSENWRWARGSAGFTIHNPQPFAVAVELRFGLRSVDERPVRLLAGEQMIWAGMVSPTRQNVRLPAILPPGDQVWRFVTAAPPVVRGHGDTRGLAISLRDFEVNLQRRVDAAERP
jgi:hypothetical protein